jgi:hypothetical protein
MADESLSDALLQSIFAISVSADPTFHHIKTHAKPGTRVRRTNHDPDLTLFSTNPLDPPNLTNPLDPLYVALFNSLNRAGLRLDVHPALSHALPRHIRLTFEHKFSGKLRRPRLPAHFWAIPEHIRIQSTPLESEPSRTPVHTDSEKTHPHERQVQLDPHSRTISRKNPNRQYLFRTCARTSFCSRLKPAKHTVFRLLVHG